MRGVGLVQAVAAVTRAVWRSCKSPLLALVRRHPAVPAQRGLDRGGDGVAQLGRVGGEGDAQRDRVAGRALQVLQGIGHDVGVRADLVLDEHVRVRALAERAAQVVDALQGPEQVRDVPAAGDLPGLERVRSVAHRRQESRDDARGQVDRQGAGRRRADADRKVDVHDQRPTGHVRLAVEVGRDHG